MRVLNVIACSLLAYGIGLLTRSMGTIYRAPTVAVTGSLSEGESQQDPAAPAAGGPADAEAVRAEIRSLESVLAKISDRGAVLFLLARKYAHLGDVQKALALLKECVELDAGFEPDPEKSRSLRPLASNADFQELLERARGRRATVHKARVAFTVPDKDLFPEGLAVDASNGQFYMGSMHRKKIVKFKLGGSVSDFVPQDVYDLSPVGGVHVDPVDHSVWASTDAGVKQRPELLHFNVQGKLLERYASPGKMPYDLNDLVLRGSTFALAKAETSGEGTNARVLKKPTEISKRAQTATEVFTTDTEGHHVYRFEVASHAFSEMKLWRQVFYPNGITLSGDENVLFVADMIGVIRVDLRTGESADVDPGPHDTLCGIDGLYWNNGELLGVQYGTGVYRVMRWKLSPDGRRVTSSETLEYRTELVSDPTTGAIWGDKFYFIANTGIYNLEDDKIVDTVKLEPVKIAVVELRR